jgi:membrane peptidoglycan carboxypeptidase
MPVETTRPLPPQSARRRPSRGRRYLKRGGITLAVVIVVLALVAGGLWIITPSAGEAVQLGQGEASEHGISYPGPAVPANFADPLIATEDHRFYSEPGVDPLAVGRVIWAKVTGGTDQGGATLEQQLAKLLYTPDETGLRAEVKQIVLAVKLNLKYSKQQILDMYGEAAYYGNGYYGLEAASCGYFGHPATQLTVTQGAMLAGVVNAPSVDDPVTNPVQAKARLTHVIDRMVAVGYLTQAQGGQALATSLNLRSGTSASC